MSEFVPAQILRGMLDAAQRANHYLPLRSGVFTPAQVGALKLALDIGKRRLTNSALAPEPGLRQALLRGGLFIRLMIDLGRDVGQLAELAHIRLQHDPDAPPDAWGLVSWADEQSLRHYWWLKLGSRDDRPMAPSDGIMLACLPESERWLELAGLPLAPVDVSVCPVAAFAKSARLFDRSEVEMHEDIAAFIGWAKGVLGPRGALLQDLPSPATIAREDISWKQNGDRVFAERVTGKESENAKKFYTYMQFRNREDYLNWREAQKRAQLERVLAKELAVLAAWVKGDDKAIDPSVLRRTLLDFDWRIDRRKDIVVEHRRITVFLWLVLSVAVTSRARREPCPSPHAIDPRTGALLVLDKRTVKIKPQSDSAVNLPPGEKLGDARIVFLPPRVRLLIIAYHEHLKSLSRRKDLLPRTRRRCESLARRLDEGLSIPFFELNRFDGTKRISHAVLRPTAIAQHTSGMLDLLFEGNFARHMLRGALVGQISHEIVDAQLGHWLQGVEPWSNGSALDPMIFRAMMSVVQSAFVSLDYDGAPVNKSRSEAERTGFPDRPRARADAMAPDMRDMRRYWELENQVLATLHLAASEETSIRQALLSAVMFGGLLNPIDWTGWVKSVTLAGVLPDPVAIFFVTSSERRMQRRWLADPLTAALLERLVASRRRPSSREKGILQCAYSPALVSLLSLEWDDFIAELKSWVLPGAQFKFTLQCPPILVAYATGSIRAHTLDPTWWGQKRTGAKPLTEAEKTKQFRMVVQNLLEKIPVQKARDVPLIDKRFHHLRAPTLAEELEASTGRVTKIGSQHQRMKDKYAEIIKWREQRTTVNLSTSLGTRITYWFYERCPTAPPAKGRSSRHAVETATMKKYAEFFGQEDWSELWKQQVAQVYKTTLVEILTNLITMQEEGNRGYAYSIANRLYGYLGGCELIRPQNVYVEKRQYNVRAHILTANQFSAVVTLLHEHPGSDAEKEACRLAAVLMFRTGLRGREAINLTIDDICVIGDVVELRVRSSQYMKLKTPMSKRTLPLHALLEPHELAELLRHRARKVRIYRGQHQFVRMFFDEPLCRTDYARLLEPIETAMRLACGQVRPKGAEYKPSYIFSRCSSLRHSFVSYAMATMLMPRDPGAFVLPAQIDPELVSLARRDRLESALLGPGHVGISTVQALRQLVGHASYRRTITTYSHLLDVVLAAHCARRSVEPALPVAVTQALAKSLQKPGKFSSAALTRQAHDWTMKEHTIARAAKDSLVAKEPPALHVLPRQRRRDGAGMKSWEVVGNSFWSQVLGQAKPKKPQLEQKLGEWRGTSTSDWQTIDAVLQLASRGVPMSIVADEVGVRADVCQHLMDRFHTIMTMKKSTRHGGPVGPAVNDGRLRQSMVISGTMKVPILLDRDLEDGSWHAPVTPIPFELNAEIDKVWARLAAALKTGPRRRVLHTFLTGHDNGKRGLRSVARANQLKDLLNELFEPQNGGIAAASIRQPATQSDATLEKGKFVVHLARTNIEGAQWSAAGLLVYLLMMTLAASKVDLQKLLLVSSQRRKNLGRAVFSKTVRNVQRPKPTLDPERLAHRRGRPVWD